MLVKVSRKVLPIPHLLIFFQNSFQSFSSLSFILVHHFFQIHHILILKCIQQSPNMYFYHWISSLFAERLLLCDDTFCVYSSGQSIRNEGDPFHCQVRLLVWLILCNPLSYIYYFPPNGWITDRPLNTISRTGLDIYLSHPPSPYGSYDALINLPFIHRSLQTHICLSTAIYLLQIVWHGVSMRWVG